MTENTEALTLDVADPQDLADIICGLTAIGGYASNAGLDNDTERLSSLRKRLVLENRELAEALADPDCDYATTGAEPESFQQGIRDILAGEDEE